MAVEYTGVVRPPAYPGPPLRRAPTPTETTLVTSVGRGPASPGRGWPCRLPKGRTTPRPLARLSGFLQPIQDVKLAVGIV